MKVKKIPLFILSVLLNSCSVRENKEVKNDDYITTIDIFKNQDDVKILQLTDLHWSFSTDVTREKNYLQKLVETADPDIIMVTGDSILGGTTEICDKLFSTLNSLKNKRGKNVYFGVTWGNHDRQGVYDKDYPDRKAIEYTETNNYEVGKEYTKYGLYRHPSSSNIYGRSNYVVNLTDGNSVIWSLYAIDSNSDYYNGLTYNYDVIHDDQVEWFKNINSDIKGKNTNVKSLAFFHIPLYETAYAYDNAKRQNNPVIANGDYGGVLEENKSNNKEFKDLVSDAVHVGYKNTHFFKAAKEGGVKGMFYGHDHLNNFWALYDDEAYYDNSTGQVVNPNGTDDDVLLAYGTKTGDGLACDSSRIGGNLITIHKNGTFNGRQASSGSDFEFVYLEY